MVARIEFDRVAPLPISRAVKLASWYWPANPHKSIEAMTRAFKEVAAAHRTPGYPQDHLSRDEEATLQTLCEMLGSDVCAEQISAEDKSRLKNLALRKISEFENSDPGKAFQIAEKAHQFFPDDLALTERLGNMFFNYERYVSAKPLYRQLLDANPGRIPLARRLHKCYLETGMHKRAQILYKHYTHHYPEDKHTLMLAGYHELHKGRAMNALSYATEVYANFNEYHGAMLLKALSFAKMGNENESGRWFDAYTKAETDAKRYGFSLSDRELSRA